jgi:hypothetical protein
MTPKEKADELFNRFYDQVDSTRRNSAVQCAIIAVEEILSVLFQHHEIDYWKEVLTELNSMK